MKIEWDKKIAVIVVIACLLLLSIGSAFLIIQHYSSYDFPEYERVINGASASAEVNLTEVQQIDYEYAKTVFASENMTVLYPTNTTFQEHASCMKSSGSDLYFYAQVNDIPDYIHGWVEIFSDHSTNKTWIFVHDRGFAVHEEDIPQEKAFLKEKIELVANACNLTVNWSTLAWSFSYQD